MKKTIKITIIQSFIFAVLALSLMATDTVAKDSTADLVEKIMREKVGTLKQDAKIAVKATKIKDPLNSAFELYRVEYKNNGRPMGGMTVSVIDHDGKKYLFSGGAIWDMKDKTELQALWSSLTETAEIPYIENRLIAGKKDACTIPIAVFSDYQCFYCKRLVPKLVKYVEENNGMCLYHYDMPLTKTHKTAKYVARMVIAYQKLAKEPVPHLIYGQKFGSSEAAINEFFEDLIRAKGIEEKDFYKVATSTETSERIEADIQLAQSLGLRGTPSVFVGGHTVTTANIEAIRELIPYIRKNLTAKNKKEPKALN